MNKYLAQARILRYSTIMPRFTVMCVMLLTAALPLYPQNQPDGNQRDEILSFVGLKLDDLVMRFGIPKTVYAVRGDEVWQDDVVFVYDEGDFYIFKDRVWQIGIKSAMGLKIGDTRAVALLILGEKAQDEGDYVLYPLPAAGWPLSLRINFNANKVTAIYVYRPDF